MSVLPESSGSNLQGIEKEPTLEFGLSPEQELFLFGDQGNITDEHDEFLVWHYKIGYSREWLATFIPEDEVPQEFIDGMKYEYEMMQDLFHHDPETFGVARPHPLALALWKEQNTGLPLEERPILSTTLIYASNTLSNEPDGKAKIEYVLNMFEEYDRKLRNWGRQGGDMSATRFPEPVESYKDKVFPASLCGSSMLF